MITILTSNFLSTKNIDERLKNRMFIKSICNDVFYAKNSVVYLIISGYYKLEFCFSKEHIFTYFMVEMYENEHLQNKYLSFIDDLKLFKNKNAINKFVEKSIDNDCVKMKNIEIYLSEGEIESIYLLSSNK